MGGQDVIDASIAMGVTGYWGALWRASLGGLMPTSVGVSELGAFNGCFSGQS